MSGDTYKTEDGRKVQGVGRFVCAFCSGWYDVAKDGGAAMHSHPACEVFELSEPGVFAMACRMAWQQLRLQLPPRLPEATA